MYRTSHVIYTIITINITGYFNQSLHMSHTTDSSYETRTPVEPIRIWHTSTIIQTRERPNNKRSCHHCLYRSYYVNWKLNGQGALIVSVYPVHTREHDFKRTHGC